MFCAQFSFELVTLNFGPFDLGMSDQLRASHVQCTNQFLASYDYLLLSYDSMWSHYHHLRMCRATWPITVGGRHKDPHFWNPWPQFTYSPRHFPKATTNIKPSYMRKIAFIQLCRLERSLCMRGITWPVHRGFPETTCNNFYPDLSIEYTPFTWLYWSIPMLNRLLPAKNLQSKVSKNSRVYGNIRA